MQEGDSPNPTPESEARTGDPAVEEPAQARGASLESELHETRRELERTRRDLDATARRLDEMARAYSGVVNDQRDFRARIEREKQRVLETERGKVAAEMLEVGDELERALAAAAGDEGPLAQGVKLIREGLMRRLAGMGIERLDLVGKPFDPNLAEAIDLQPVGDPALDDQVIEELTPAYRLGERLLRAARVKVARYLKPADVN